MGLQIIKFNKNCNFKIETEPKLKEIEFEIK